MRRFLAIILLAVLPLQFSWAAVALYCEHDIAGAGHSIPHDHGHDHGHAHHADTRHDSGPAAGHESDASPTPDEAVSAAADAAPGALDLDCGHCCHGTCSVMLAWPVRLPGALSTAHPSATVDDKGGAAMPTRPERPQWLPLA